MRFRVLAALALVPAACAIYSPSLLDPAEAGVDAGVEAAIDAPAFDASGDVADAGPRCDPTKPFGSAVPVLGLSGGSYDRLVARLTPDELTAYVYFSIDGGAAIGVAERTATDKAFGPLNTAGVTLATFFGISGDQLYLVSSTGTTVRECRRPQLGVGFAACTPFPFVDPLDAATDYLGYPQLLPNGQTVYGVMRNNDPDGGAPTYQLAVSRLSTGTWSKPAPVPGFGPTTTFTTMIPFVLPDERTIYFAGSIPGATDAAPTYDILVARRASPTDAFGAPETVYELTTKNTEMPSWVSEDECVIYLTSTRTDGFRYIYRAQRPL